MAITHPAKRYTRRRGPRALGPPIIFAAAALSAFSALAWLATALPRDFVLPLTSTLLFVLAGAVGLFAWSRGRLSEQHRTAPQVTYWDVAGALTFVGICAAALVDPDQMLRLVEGVNRKP